MRGPSHSNSGLPVTSLGRVIEQVRLSTLPAMTGDGEDEDIEMLAGSAENNYNHYLLYITVIMYYTYLR